MRSREFARRYLRYNFGLKAVSLLLAIGLWLAIASGRLR
jgi:hypothetical protein